MLQINRNLRRCFVYNPRSIPKLSTVYRSSKTISATNKTDILYKGMYTNTCSSVSTLKVRVWSYE